MEPRDPKSADARRLGHPSSSTSQRAKPRDASIDIAKGLAIIAIVFGHVLRGLGASDILDTESALFIATDRAVYMVHLAVFAFTAGLMVRASIEKRGAWPYARERVGEFLWLYLLWSILQGLVSFVLSSFVNNPRPFWSIFALWEPDSQLWFFPWIALMTAAVAIAQPWKSTLRGLVSLVLALGVSLLNWGIFGEFAFTQGLGLTVFYFVAATFTFTRYRKARAALGDWGAAGVLVAGGAGYVLLLVFTSAIGPTSDPGDARSPATIATGFVCSWVGVLAILALSILLERIAPARVMLGYLGRQSLIIFLAHTLAQAGTRIILSRLGVDDGTLQLIAGTLVGLGAPLVLWMLTRRWAPWLWTLPTFAREKAATRP